MHTISHQGVHWHDFVASSRSEVEPLLQEYGFHELDIVDCFSDLERPKIDEYDNYLFLVLHIPYYDPTQRRIIKEEVNIFMGDDYVVTLHDGNLDFLVTLRGMLAESEEQREEFFGKGTGYFLYRLINAFFELGFPLIDNINRKMRGLEAILFDDSQYEERALRVILELKRSIIAMRRILLPQRTVVSALEHKSKRFIPEELDVYFDDVQDAVERQWALLETAKEVVEALRDSHESWIQSKTNRIIRVLTVFSVTMLPLTMITSLYGMNVRLPYAQDPYAFAGIVSVLLTMLAASLVYFGWRRWL